MSLIEGGAFDPNAETPHNNNGELRPALDLLRSPAQREHYEFLGDEALLRAAELVELKHEEGVRNVISLVSGVKCNGEKVRGTCYPTRDGVRVMLVAGKPRRGWPRSARDVNRIIFHELRHAQQMSEGANPTGPDYQGALKAKPFGRLAACAFMGITVPTALYGFLPNAASDFVIREAESVTGLSEIIPGDRLVWLIGAAAVAVATSLIRPIRELGANYAYAVSKEILNTVDPYERDARKAEKLARGNPVVARRKRA